MIERMNALEVIPNALGFYFLGQVGLAIKGPDGTIYIDPYLSDYAGPTRPRVTRNFPPPLEPNRITNASAVLISHDHIDHFDPETLTPISIASPQAVFVGAHTCDFASLGISDERWGHPHVLEPFMVGGASITAIPSAHTDLERNGDGLERFTYLGYVIQWNGVTVYHAGDTVIWDGNDPNLQDVPATDRLRQGLIGLLSSIKIDVAFVPINGRDYFRTAQGILGNTDFREAAELAEAIAAKVIVPTHFDLFARNAADPGHFVSYLHRLNPNRSHKIMRPGELFYYLCETQ